MCSVKHNCLWCYVCLAVSYRWKVMISMKLVLCASMHYWFTVKVLVDCERWWSREDNGNVCVSGSLNACWNGVLMLKENEDEIMVKIWWKLVLGMLTALGISLVIENGEDVSRPLSLKCFYSIFVLCKLAKKERWRLWCPWWLFENGDECTMMSVFY